MVFVELGRMQRRRTICRYNYLALSDLYLFTGSEYTWTAVEGPKAFHLSSVNLQGTSVRRESLPFITLLKLEEYPWVRAFLEKVYFAQLYDGEENCALKLFPQFLNQFGQCSSLRDAWTLKVGNTGLWQRLVSAGGLVSFHTAWWNLFSCQENRMNIINI